MNKGIRHIIFDLGNVILDLDYQRLADSFQILSDQDFNTFRSDEAIRNILVQFEIGQCTTETFLNTLQRKITPVPDARQLIHAWNSLLVGIPPERLELLARLKSAGYQLYLLSNTNSLHIKWLNHYLLSEHKVSDFNQRFFTKTYYSYLIKMRKPDREIFNFVLADAHLKAAETLFIDDHIANIESASALGIATLHHDPAISLNKVLQNFLK